MWQQIITDALPHILIPIVLAALAYLVPYRRPAQTAFYKITEGDKKEFWKWKRKYSLFFLAMMVCLSYIYSILFFYLAQLSIKANGNYVFSITPSRIAWSAPGILCSFATISVILNYFERSYWGDRYDYMQHLYNSQLKWDAEKLTKIVSVACGILTLICFILLLNYYVKIDEKKIYYNSLLSFSTKEYSFEEIAAIKKFKERFGGDRFEVVFSDSSKWNSGWGLELPNNDSLLKYISDKTSHSVEIVLTKN